MKCDASVIFILSLFLFAQNIYAQHNSPDTIIATYINEKTDFDGKLSEPFWKTVFSVNNFTQRELDYGKP